MIHNTSLNRVIVVVICCEGCYIITKFLGDFILPVFSQFKVFSSSYNDMLTTLHMIITDWIDP